MWIPGDASQISNHIEEVFLWHFAEAWVLWEGDDGGTIFPSASCGTETPHSVCGLSDYILYQLLFTEATDVLLGIMSYAFPTKSAWL